MCGSMRVGGKRLDIGSKVPVLNTETGETQELPWEGHCRDDALAMGNWNVRKPEVRAVYADAYWERSGRGGPCLYPMQKGQAIKVVVADSISTPGKRAAFVVTREATEDEVMYAIRLGCVPHSRHPAFFRGTIPMQSAVPEDATA